MIISHVNISCGVLQAHGLPGNVESFFNQVLNFRQEGDVPIQSTFLIFSDRVYGGDNPQYWSNGQRIAAEIEKRYPGTLSKSATKMNWNSNNDIVVWTWAVPITRKNYVRTLPQTDARRYKAKGGTIWYPCEKGASLERVKEMKTLGYEVSEVGA